MNVIDGKPAESYQYKFVRHFLMSKIKEGLGFGRCSIFASAAAPMSSDLKRYFMSVDLPIVEAFGMSESSGAQCFGEIFCSHFRASITQSNNFCNQVVRMTLIWIRLVNHYLEPKRLYSTKMKMVTVR